MADENKYNIKIECGTDFVLPFLWTDDNGSPVDLTGATVSAQLREYSGDPDAFDFICAHNGVGGRITLAMPNEVTKEIPYSYGVYDVRVTLESGVVKEPLYGDVRIQDEVTKPIDGTALYMVGISTYEDLPTEGITNRLYFVNEDRKVYRWNGTNYVATAVGNGIQRIDYLDGGTYRMVFDDGTYFDFVSVPRIMGVYDATVAYEKLDIVHGTDGATYIAKIPVPAETALSNATYWQQLTQKTPTITSEDVSYDYAQTHTDLVTNTGTADTPNYHFKVPRGVTGNESIDDTAREGDNDVVWSASKTFKEIDSLNHDIDSLAYNGNLNIFNGEFPQVGNILNDGTEYDSNNFVRTDYIPVMNFEKLYFIRSVSPYQLMILFYSDTKISSFVSYAPVFSKNTTATENSVLIPQDAKYYRLAEKSNPALGTLCISYRKLAEYVAYKIDFKLKENVVSNTIGNFVLPQNVNIFDEQYPKNGYINADGTDMTSTYYKRTGYIEIDNTNKRLYFYRTSDDYDMIYCIYDANQLSLTGRKDLFSRDDGFYYNVVDIPVNAKYIRLSAHKATYAGNIIISYTLQEKYLPYGLQNILSDGNIKESNLVNAFSKRINSLANKTIVFMGDSIIGNLYDQLGICFIMGQMTGANVINCAFGGTMMAKENSQSQQLVYWSKLSGTCLADAIALNDFTDQDEAVENITHKPSYFANRLATLKAVDWNTVDYLMWEYGTNDFSDGNILIKDPNDLTSQVTYYGAYCHFIETILTAYPHLKLIAITPLWRWWRDEDNDNAYIDGSDEHPISGQYLYEFVECAKEVAKKYHLPYIDNYYDLGMNQFTRLQFFDATDGVHPNANGRRKIAEKITHQLITIY